MNLRQNRILLPDDSSPYCMSEMYNLKFFIYEMDLLYKGTTAIKTISSSSQLLLFKVESISSRTLMCRKKERGEGLSYLYFIEAWYVFDP